MGAKAVGIRTVFARYGDTFGTLQSGADYEIDDIHELLPLIDGLSGEAPRRPSDPAAHRA